MRKVHIRGSTLVILSYFCFVVYLLRQLIKIGEGLGGAIKPTPSGVGYMDPSQQTCVLHISLSLV